MAQLTNKLGNTFFINRYHIFGRDPKIAHTLLTDLSSSQFHASIFFENNSWYLQDYSRNGLVLNNEIIRQRRIPLHGVNTIELDKKEWIIENLDPPCSFLMDYNRRFIELQGDLSEIIFCGKRYRLNKNKQGIWFLTNKKKIIRLIGGEVFDYKGLKWTFIENDCMQETIFKIGTQLDKSISIEFLVSQDYENIKMCLFLKEKECFSSYSSCYFTLYLLAEQSIQDQREMKNLNDIGWIHIESLLQIMSKELVRDCDVYYLNLQIHRIRNQLTKTNPELSDLIQRRKGEIRIKPILINIKGTSYTLLKSS